MSPTGFTDRPLQTAASASAAMILPVTNLEWTTTPTPIELTVVIPTRNESGNISELLRRLDSALGSLNAEVVFVDDSDDDTPARIHELLLTASRTVTLLHRTEAGREGGLGSAVVQGFRLARAPWAVVMDGDLQHPPEVVPLLLAEGERVHADLVVASRYGGAGSNAGLGSGRRIAVSTVCTAVARLLFPRRLDNVPDPMSGFFALRMAATDLEVLRPSGYKILFEILARSAPMAVSKVPFVFQPRFSGESKATLRQGLTFGRQLLALRFLAWVLAARRLVGFAAIGLSGVVVNAAALAVLTGRSLHVHYLLASVIATQAAIIWNFALIDLVVFRRHRHGVAALRFGRFWLLNVSLLPLQLLALWALVSGASMSAQVGNLVVLAAVFGLRYAVSSKWIYQAQQRPVTEPAVNDVPAQRRHDPAVGAPPSVVVRLRSRLVLRLVIPAGVTLLACPNVPLALSGASRATRALDAAVLATSLMIALFSTRPRRGEPNVHDRQLDAILGIPFLAVSFWFSTAWPGDAGLRAPLSDHEVGGLVALLTGSVIVLLGTRVTARLRWSLVALLGLSPSLTARPPLAVAFLVLAALGGLAPVFQATWQRRSGREAVPPRTQGHLSHHWPTGWLAPLLVALFAVALGWHQEGASWDHSSRPSGADGASAYTQSGAPR